MDAKFHPAMVAIKLGDLERFRTLLRQDPSLATSRSSTSHPTLLQCLVLSGKDVPNKIEMAQILIEAGAELNEPFVACGSCDNVEVGELLLDSGAAIDGVTSWSPIEEALYWHNPRSVEMLLRRGASIHNLRIAAGLGRTDVIEAFFNAEGSLKPEAGKVDWPWRDLHEKFFSFAQDRQAVINNAFVYACMHGHIDAATLLMNKGAQVNVIPGGFDFAGTGLHYAALNGHQAMVEFLLEQGADVRIKDEKVGGTAAGWAEYGRHPEVSDYLKAKETS
jgi:Ankyrin repeats (3 copies)